MAIPYVAPLTRRVTAIIRNGTPAQLHSGRTWYATAHGIGSEFAAEYGVTVECALGVIAALSPQLGWWQNVMLARQALDAGIMAQGHTHDNMRKVNAILAGAEPLDVLGGLKVRSFYRNMRSGGFDVEHVTVDRHAFDIATGVRLNGASLTPNRYAETAETYKRAAVILQGEGFGNGGPFTPAMAQATAWVIHRENLGIA